MFASKLKSLTPGSSKSTSPVPPEFEVDDQIENYINDPRNDPERNGGFFLFFSYYIQHCFICRPSDSTVPTDAGIEPRTVATGALAARCSNH